MDVTFALRFKRAAAGRTFTVESTAADDLGQHEGTGPLGIVTAKPHHPRIAAPRPVR